MSAVPERRLPGLADAAAVGFLFLLAREVLIVVFVREVGIVPPAGSLHLLMAAVCLGYAVCARLDPVATFRFRLPRRSVWLPTFLMAVCAFPVVLLASILGGALLILLGFDFTSDLERIEQEIGRIPPIFLTLFPAVGEELLFRGIFLAAAVSLLSRSRAVFYTAVLFGLFHMLPPLYIHTFLLGLMFGWLVVATGSLWPAVLAHGLHNVIALVVGNHMELMDQALFSLLASLPGLLGVIWGVILIRRYSEADSSAGGEASAEGV